MHNIIPILFFLIEFMCNLYQKAKEVHHIKEFDHISKYISSNRINNELILTMGAGNVGQFATQLPKLLTEALENRVSSPLPLLT